MYKRKCKICSGTFMSKYIVSNYCSDSCYIRMRKLTRQKFKPIYINCKLCGNKKLARASNVEYCSTTCQQKSAYIRSNGHRKEMMRNHYYKTKFGVSYKDVEEMKKVRNNLCDICNKKCELVLDHCHTTGNIRGMLCQMCNKGLGHFCDNVGSLGKAISYLTTKKL